MSPIIISLFIFCIWPLVIGFVGYLIGRRRLVIRSPILVHRREESDDESEPGEQPVIRRLARRDVGFGK